jgi:hypothetical protein
MRGESAAIWIFVCQSCKKLKSQYKQHHVSYSGAPAALVIQKFALQVLIYGYFPSSIELDVLTFSVRIFWKYHFEECT